MENDQNIDLRTEEVRDILKRMPHWTIRWGTTIIAVAVVLLFVFSYLYRYPDLIKADVVVSAANPPAEIKARSTGKITGLFVGNNEKVTAGQTLAVIENPARIDDVELIRNYLSGIGRLIDTPDEKQASLIVEEVCKKLLANPVMEDYSTTIEKV